MGLRVMLLGPFFIGGIILRGFLKIFLWLLLAIVNGILFWGGVYLIQNSYYELGVIIISALLLIDFFIHHISIIWII